MRKLIRRVVYEDVGANLVEYAFLISFIVLVAVIAVTAVGNATSSNIESVAPGLNGGP